MKKVDQTENSSRMYLIDGTNNFVFGTEVAHCSTELIEASLFSLLSLLAPPPLTCVLYSLSVCFPAGGTVTPHAPVGGFLRVWCCGGGLVDRGYPWTGRGPEFVGDLGGKPVLLPKVKLAMVAFRSSCHEENLAQINLRWNCGVQPVRVLLAPRYPQRSPVVVYVQKLQARRRNVLAAMKGRPGQVIK